MLIALLATGMDGLQALALAPWSAAEIDDLCEQSDRRQPWSTADLAAEVRLLDVEREMGKLWSLRPPVDVPRSIVQARRKYQRRVYERNYKRNRRSKAKELQNMATDLDAREETLIVTLAAHGTSWVAAGNLLGEVMNGRAWLGPDGKPIETYSKMKACSRALDRLEKQGLITSKYEIGRTGLKTRFVRSERVVDTVASTSAGTWTRGHGADTSRPEPEKPCGDVTSAAPDPVHSASGELSTCLLTSGTVDTPPAPPASAPRPAITAEVRGPSQMAADVRVTVDRLWPPHRVRMLPGVSLVLEQTP
jgi:hypothetical protein